LAEWVATLPWGPAPAELPRVLVPNDGDERADARALPRFSSGDWRREAVEVLLPGGRPASALGLVDHERRQRVIELDDFSQPLLVSPGGANAIAELERTWPDVELSATSVAEIRGESEQLRWAIVDRLTTESAAPAPQVFELLPWELVDEMAAAVTRAAAGEPLAPVRPLRHYFVVTGTRFSAALEQVRAGLEYHDSAMVSEGSRALCFHLCNARPERVPGTTRALLAGTVSALASRDPSLASLARQTGHHLLDLAGAEPGLSVARPSLREWVASLLDAAAAAVLRAQVALSPVPVPDLRGRAPGPGQVPLAVLEVRLEPTAAEMAGVEAAGRAEVFGDQAVFEFPLGRGAARRPVRLVVVEAGLASAPAVFVEEDDKATAVLNLPLPTTTAAARDLGFQFFVTAPQDG
jgi:hypothetical protein